MLGYPFACLQRVLLLYNLIGILKNGLTFWTEGVAYTGAYSRCAQYAMGILKQNLAGDCVRDHRLINLFEGIV